MTDDIIPNNIISNDIISNSIIQIYKDQYMQLVNYRLHLITEIEKTNNQLTDIIKKAKKENIDVVRISAAT